LGASSANQNFLERLTGDDREPWNPLQIGNNTYNIGLQLNTWQYPTYMIGPMQDKQTTLIDTLFPDQARLQSADDFWCDTTQAQPNRPARTGPKQPVHEDTLQNGFPTSIDRDILLIDTQIHPSWQSSTFEQGLFDNCWPQQVPGSAVAQTYSKVTGAEQKCNPAYVCGTEALSQDWPLFAMDEEDFQTAQYVSRRRVSQYDAPHGQVLPAHDDLAFCGDVHSVTENSSPSACSWPRCNDSNARRRSGGSREQNIPSHNVLQIQKQRRRITTSAFEKPPGTGPLRLPLHNDQKIPFMLSPTALVAGGSRRKGPLTLMQRTSAAANRKNKSICIRCRQNKISVRCHQKLVIPTSNIM
jgi:hypothetical protein